MLRSIITHPGGAHKDDLLAVCVLIAHHKVPVYRREPSSDELKDAAVAIVDVGEVHDPELNNYDHHHFPREHPPTCSLSLVLDDLGLYEDALRFCDWLETAEWFDSRGPNKTAAWLDVPRRAISQLNSPVDVSLLRRFARETELHPGSTLYEFMVMIGEDLLEYLRVARERLDFVGEHSEDWELDCGGEACRAVFLPRTEPLVDEPSGAVASFIRHERGEQEIAALVYPDRRGQGYGIQRYEDHPRLDFSRVDGEADVHFAHKSGFMCKTGATDPARLKQLIQQAWVPA